MQLTHGYSLSPSFAIACDTCIWLLHLTPTCAQNGIDPLQLAVVNYLVPVAMDTVQVLSYCGNVIQELRYCGNVR